MFQQQEHAWKNVKEWHVYFNSDLIVYHLNAFKLHGTTFHYLRSSTVCKAYKHFLCIKNM